MIAQFKRFAICACLFSFCVILLPEVKTYAIEKENKKVSEATSHYIMGLLYDRLDQVERAIAEYKQSLERNYESAAAHLRLAADYIKNNQLDPAVKELNLAIEFDPDAFEPQIVLALLYTSQGKLKEANLIYEQTLKKALQSEPQNTALYKSLGEIYIQQKRLNEAIEAYKKVLAISPSDAEAHFFLGVIHQDKNEKKQAEAEFKEAIKLKGDFAEALNSLGYFYAEDGVNLDEAEALIKKALEIDPQNGAYVDSLGWVYFKKNKFKEALKELERAATLMDDPIITEHLNQAKEKLKNK